MKSFLKDLTSVGLSKVLVILFGLLNSILIARLLGPVANGIIDSFNVYTSLFMTIGSLGVRQSTTYFVGQKRHSLLEIKNAIVTIWLFTSIICIVFCGILIYFLNNNGDNILWVSLAIMPIPFSLFNTYNSGIFLGQNKIKAFNRINWIPVFVTFFSGIILIWIFDLKITGVLIAILLGNISITVVLIFKENIFKFFTKKPNFNLIKKMLSLGIIYAISLLIINLNYKLDVILLDNMSSNYQIGIYGKGVKIMEYMWQIPMLLSTIIFARSATAKDGKIFSYKVILLLRVSLLIVGVGSLVLYFIGPSLITLLFGEEFFGSGEVLKVLLPGVVLLTLFKVLNMDLAGKGKPWISMKAMIPSLLVNVVFNYFFIPKYGAFGAALSSTISYSIAAVIFLHHYQKEVNIPYREILFYKKSDFLFMNHIVNKFKSKKN